MMRYIPGWRSSITSVMRGPVIHENMMKMTESGYRTVKDCCEALKARLRGFVEASRVCLAIVYLLETKAIGPALW